MSDPAVFVFDRIKKGKIIGIFIIDYSKSKSIDFDKKYKNCCITNNNLNNGDYHVFYDFDLIFIKKLIRLRKIRYLKK